MVATVVIIVILVVIGFMALRSSMQHFKGDGGCCGGGGDVTFEEPDKILENVIGTKLIKIDGMTCINCQNRVKRALNKIEGVSAKVDYKKGEAKIEYDREISDDSLKLAIEMQDYKVKSIN